jgi:hypothetical protein
MLIVVHGRRRRREKINEGLRAADPPWRKAFETSQRRDVLTFHTLRGTKSHSSSATGSATTPRFQRRVYRSGGSLIPA